MLQTNIVLQINSNNCKPQHCEPISQVFKIHLVGTKQILEVEANATEIDTEFSAEHILSDSVSWLSLDL